MSHFKGIEVKSLATDPSVNGCTEFDGKDFKITINHGLACFMGEMGFLWAYKFPMKKGLDQLKESGLSFQIFVDIFKKLMTAFYQNKVSENFVSRSTPTKELKNNQIEFAMSLKILSIHYSIAHEFGHVVMKFQPSYVSKYLKAVKNVANHFVHTIFNVLLPNWPRRPEVANWKEDKFVQSWVVEFLADIIGMELMLCDKDSKVDTFDQVFLTISDVFNTYDVLEHFHEKINGQMYPIGTHPFAWLRLQMLKSVLYYGKKLDKINLRNAFKLLTRLESFSGDICWDVIKTLEINYAWRMLGSSCLTAETLEDIYSS
jgi:hypothetical protein